MVHCSAAISMRGHKERQAQRFQAPAGFPGHAQTKVPAGSVEGGAAAFSAPPITFPGFRPAGPGRSESSFRQAQVNWVNQYHRLLIVAALVIAAVTAHNTRFGLSTSGSLPISAFELGCLQISIVIALSGMLALGLYKSRDARTVGIGIDGCTRVINASATLLGLIALVRFVLNIDIARGFFVLALPSGMAGLIAARWRLRQRLITRQEPGHYLPRVISLARPDAVRYAAGVTTEGGQVFAY